MKVTTHFFLRASLVAGGCAAGAFCLYAAFNNGSSMTDDATGGIMFGLALAAVVFVSWLMLPLADWRAREGSIVTAWGVRVLWLAALGFVVLNSVFYAAMHRTDLVSGKELRIEAYAEAKAEEATAKTELNGMKESDLWQETHNCSQIGGYQQRNFCGKVDAAKARIEKAKADIAKGKPGSKDAGAEVVAWIIGGDADKVGKAWPVYLGFIVEVTASLCWKFAFLGGKAEPEPKVEEVPVKLEVVEETLPDRSAAARALANRRWNKEETKPKPGIKLLKPDRTAPLGAKAPGRESVMA